jgi:hypothetical protein
MDHQKSVLWLPNLAVTRHRAAVVHAQQVPEMQTVMQSKNSDPSMYLGLPSTLPCIAAVTVT